MFKHYFVDIIGNQNEIVFSGYICVNDINKVTNFYDFSLPCKNDSSWRDILLPTNCRNAYPAADNKFPFTACGINFQSKSLKEYLDSECDMFGLYNSTPGKIDYKLWSYDKCMPNENYKIHVSSVIIPHCFKKGTKILCLNRDNNEEYVSVEDIKKGDLIKTYLNGFRSIERIYKNYIINKPEDSKNSMYKILKCDHKFGQVFKNLTLVGDHAVLVEKITDEQTQKEKSYYGNVFELDGKICNHSFLHEKFQKVTEKRIYECYQIILQCDDNDKKEFGIWANGLLIKLSYPSGNSIYDEEYKKQILEQHLNFVKNKSNLEFNNEFNEQKEIVSSIHEPIIKIEKVDLNEQYNKQKEKFDKIKDETDQIEASKKELENQKNILQEQINALSKSKTEIENSLKEVEKTSEDSINRLNLEITNLLQTKDDITNKAVEVNTVEQTIQEELETSQDVQEKNEENN